MRERKFYLPYQSQPIQWCIDVSRMVDMYVMITLLQIFVLNCHQNKLKIGQWFMQMCQKTFRATLYFCLTVRITISFAVLVYTLLVTAGYSGDGRGKRSVWHYPNWRQLHEYRQGRHVGSQCLRQHRQVPAVSADGQRRRRHRCLPRSLRYQGINLSLQFTLDPSLVSSSQSKGERGAFIHFV